MDLGSEETQDEAAVTGEAGRCYFPGHPPHRNTAGKAGRLVPLIPGLAGLSGLSEQAECLRWALRVLKPTV